MSTTAPLKPGKARSRQPRGWRKWLYRVLAMTVVPLLLLGLVEIALRACGFGYPTDFFLMDTESSGPRVMVHNARFKQRFFPTQLAKANLMNMHMEVPAVKPAGTCRIFVLGESAALGIPDPAYSFSRVLEVMLRHRYPEVTFEVLNASIGAINSHVVLCIAKECARLQPDAFVVLLGNNEVVGPFGAAGVQGPFLSSVGLIRANLWAKTFRTGQFVNWCMEPSASSKHAPAGQKVFESIAQARIPADDERLTAIYRNYRTNLQDICAAGTGAGASVFLCTVPCNLRDSAPFASAHRSNLAAAEETAWSKEYDEGSRLEKAEKFAEALACYDAAAAIDDRFADLAFRQGRCCLALRKAARAREFFVQARDLDAVQFRSAPRINDAIRERCADWGAHLIDVEDAFTRNSPDSIPGEELFLEHVHFTFPGNCLLARNVFASLRDQLPKLAAANAGGDAEPLSDSECVARLAFTKWNEYQFLQYIAKDMFPRPPFTSQLDHAERAKRWSRRLDDMKLLLDGEGLDKVAAEYDRAIQESPKDSILRSKYAHLLLAMNNPLDAETQMGAALDLAPRDPKTLSMLAGQFAATGRLEDAARSYHKALRFAPNYSTAHFGLAQVLAAQGRIKESTDICAARVHADANPASALMNWSGILARAGREDEAKAKLLEALAYDPEQAVIHALLGNIAAREGKSKEALDYFDAALKLDPELPGLSAQVSKLRETLKH